MDYPDKTDDLTIPLNDNQSERDFFHLEEHEFSIVSFGNLLGNFYCVNFTYF